MSGRLLPEVKEFVEDHEIAVLSTLSRQGHVEGATIYYRFSHGYFYILTKSESAKAHNMLAHPQVALTIFDAAAIKTVQMQGRAQIEADLHTKRIMFDSLVRPRSYNGDQLMPPVTQLPAGSFILFRIRLTRVQYTNYKDTTRLETNRVRSNNKARRNFSENL